MKNKQKIIIFMSIVSILFIYSNYTPHTLIFKIRQDWGIKIQSNDIIYQEIDEELGFTADSYIDYLIIHNHQQYKFENMISTGEVIYKDTIFDELNYQHFVEKDARPYQGVDIERFKDNLASFVGGKMMVVQKNREGEYKLRHEYLLIITKAGKSMINYLRNCLDGWNDCRVKYFK